MVTQSQSKNEMKFARLHTYEIDFYYQQKYFRLKNFKVKVVWDSFFNVLFKDQYYNIDDHCMFSMFSLDEMNQCGLGNMPISSNEKIQCQITVYDFFTEMKKLQKDLNVLLK